MTHTVVIDGVAHEARKGFYHGTHRTSPPEETLTRIWQAAPTVGLTRLADITGLDRIGIPTVVGFRPNSPTLTTSGGKGFHAGGHGLGRHGSRRGVARRESGAGSHPRPHAELAAQNLTIDEELLPLTRHAFFRPDRPEPWVWGWDVISQRAVAVPYACVSMGNTDHRPTTRWMPFAAGSNSLAGGNHLLESFAAALYEVVERDAVACARAADGGMSGRVDLDSVTDPSSAH